MTEIKIEGFSEIQEMLKEYREGGALELQQYRAIGTVEECREARKRQRAKKRVLDSYCGFDSYECPACGTEPVGGSNYCHKCGQRLE